MYDGLHSYEQVMLTLGTVMFLTLLGLLTYSVIKEKAYKALLGAFVVPVVMMGFPAVKAFNFMNGKVELKEAVNRAEEDPTAPGMAEQLDKALEEVENRESTISDPEDKKIIEKAQQVRKLVRIAQSAKQEEQSPTELKRELAELKRGKARRLLSPMSFEKVEQAIQRIQIAPRPARETREEPDTESGTEEAQRRYLAAMTAFNKREHAKYDAAFARPLKCFYGAPGSSIEARRPHEQRSSKLFVSPGDIQNVTKLSDDRIAFCDEGAYVDARGIRRSHEKLIVMQREGSDWRIIVESEPGQCSSYANRNPCK